MFIRRKANKSGSFSIQIVEKRDGKSKVIQSIGCSKREEVLKSLECKAKQEIDKLKKQIGFNFVASPRESAALQMLDNSFLRCVGPELILGSLFDKIGFNQISETLFKDIVLARLTYPSSKLRTTQYLLHHHSKEISVASIYRFLDRLESKYQKQVEELAYNYSKSVLGQIVVVFYDMTTLYFEAEREDELRRVGFSKDGKFQHPQIMLGLLVGEDGYPVSYDIFEGNTHEGKTLLPMLERAQKRFNLPKSTVVADSALLSKENISLLCKNEYKFILGARIKSENKEIKEQILERCADLRDKESIVIEKPDGTKLIVGYSEKRAKKDQSNREKGIARLNKKIGSGKLTKASINNRGYNKFLQLSGEVKVTLDSTKIEEDKKWDGLKGYLTNSLAPKEEVIATYSQLWKIEKAFRISKTDLRIRPIYHRKKGRIEAHICIAFVAYTVFKELERLLKKNKLPFSPQRAIDLMKTIFQISVYLPDSNRTQTQFIGLSEEQNQLLKIVDHLRVSH